MRSIYLNEVGSLREKREGGRNRQQVGEALFVCACVCCGYLCVARQGVPSVKC